jgi:hypothetical protein
MKAEVKRILKEKGKSDIFTIERLEITKQLMRHAIADDTWLKNYLSLDPLNRAEWCADHLIKLVESELI